MAVLDAKLPAWQASTKAITPTKAEAKVLEGKAPLVIDGGGLNSGVRVLLKNQTKQEQNGLFEITTNEAFAGSGNFAGSGKFGVGDGWTLTRTADADSSGEVTEGMLVQVEDGETNQRTSWIQRSPGPIEVGVSPQSFEALSALPSGPFQEGQLESTYVAPLIKEAIIDNSKIEGNAGIKASKLDLEGGVDSTDLATSAKQLFPQLSTATDRKINFGSGTCKWGVKSLESEEATIEHGLGAKPAAVLASVTDQGTQGIGTILRAGSIGSVSFKIKAKAQAEVAEPATTVFNWIAIG